ncbi:hnRNP-like protein RNA recognition motif (RRM) containing protein [Gracilaria domingensis]|nr:hnRNP-like protein RNA recognition motif (RRM) containing protein [Gracilaria domingensis]
MAGALHVGVPSSSAPHSTTTTTHKKVFVGGLSWETDEQSLRDYFGRYGSVSDCVIMRDRLTGHPRGFGFVTYDDQLVAERVAAEFHELDGRQVEAKIAVPRSECVPPSRSNAWRATKKVFIGGLPATCREADLHAHFIRFGDIAECQVMYDHQTGNSRGFGFVTFTSELTVDRVVDIDHEIMQKHVEVKRAEPKQALEARRGREAAGAALPFPSSQPSSSSLHVSPQKQHSHLPQTSQTLQPHIASATSIPYASFPPALPNATSLSMARSPPTQSPFQSFSPWSGVFSSGAGSSWNAVQSSSAFVSSKMKEAASIRNSHSAATGATSISPPSSSIPSQSSSRATPAGMGFFTRAQSYSPDLAQCAYDAFYAPSPPLTSFASDLASVIPTARTERRFHPYSTRERIERSYR